jgi:hypothetical protein
VAISRSGIRPAALACSVERIAGPLPKSEENQQLRHTAGHPRDDPRLRQLLWRSLPRRSGAT